MDAQTTSLWTPWLQTGAFGLCLIMLYLFVQAMKYWAKRDEERQAEDQRREARMAAVIEENQRHARDQAREISTIAVASVKAIERSNENGATITRILQNLERRVGSGLYKSTGAPRATDDGG